MSVVKLAITDRDGWRQEVTVDKTILHIGSDSRSEVVLNPARGGGVAARHLQLITVAGNLGGCRLVNVGDVDVLIGPQGGQRLAPRAVTTWALQDQVRVGDFVIVLLQLGAANNSANGRASNVLTAPVIAPATEAAHGAATTAAAANASGPVLGNELASVRHFRLLLNCQETQLAVGETLNGTVTLHHTGDQAGAQFNLEIEGLDPEFCEIGPGPILFPNAQKEVAFRIQHLRKPNLPSGRLRFQIRATAPEAYPHEVQVVSHTLQVETYYDHQVHWVMD